MTREPRPAPRRLVPPELGPLPLLQRAAIREIWAVLADVRVQVETLEAAQ